MLNQCIRILALKLILFSFINVNLVLEIKKLVSSIKPIL